MESRARMRECHTGRWSVCYPAGEQMRTNYILPLKSHEAKRSGIHSVMSNSLWPHGLSMEFSRPEYWSGYSFDFPGDLPNPGIEPRFPALQVDSLPAEPPGKPKNTGVGSLSLLQWMFPIQESNWSLLHCGWILYQRSYQGSQREVMVCSIILFSDACRPSLERPIKQKMKWKS